MGNILGVVVLFVLLILFGFLAIKAWGSKRGFIKWPGGILASLLTLVLLLVTGVAVMGLYKMNNAPNTYNTPDIKVSMAPENVARGEKLAYTCIGCHSSSGQLPLDGSKDNFMAGDGPPMGVMYAPNLTPAGPLKDYTDGQILRAIREGVDNQGKPLIIMPSETFHYLSDADAQAIVAYLRSQPATQPDRPRKDLNLITAIFVGAGMFPTSAQTPISQPVVAPAAGTPEYGKYLVDSLGCHDCHGPDLGGKAPGQGPSGPNLTVIVPKWSQDNFINLFRKGLDPSGKTISDEMPWKDYTRTFSDSELQDIYNYIHSLQPIVK